MLPGPSTAIASAQAQTDTPATKRRLRLGLASHANSVARPLYILRVVAMPSTAHASIDAIGSLLESSHPDATSIVAISRSKLARSTASCTAGDSAKASSRPAARQLRGANSRHIAA